MFAVWSCSSSGELYCLRFLLCKFYSILLVLLSTASQNAEFELHASRMQLNNMNTKASQLLAELDKVPGFQTNLIQQELHHTVDQWETANKACLECLLSSLFFTHSVSMSKYCRFNWGGGALNGFSGSGVRALS